MQKRRAAQYVVLALVVLLAVIVVASAAVQPRQAQPLQRAQTAVLIPGMLEHRVMLPSPLLSRLQTTKQKADVSLLRSTYFVQNNIPHIRVGARAYQLLPLSAMQIAPTAAQLQKSQVLTPTLSKYQAYILRHVFEPGVISVGVDHRSKQTPVKDQGSRGTCVCFASMAGLEVAYGSTTLDLSENYSNYLYQKAEGHGCKSAGLATHMSADYLSANGVCQDTLCPYQFSFPGFCNNGGSPAPSQRTNAQSHAPYKIKSYQKIWRKDDLATDTGTWINNPGYLESILDSGKDIIFGTHVAGWTSPYTGVLDVKLDGSGNPLPSVGGHALLIVGYNRTGGYFIVKNSWGTGVGQAGYLYLSYDYLRTYAKYGYIINEVWPAS